jgi:COP9 signalosome complex subunit 12
MNAWVEALVCHWKLAYILERDEDAGLSWQKAYEGQKETMLFVFSLSS